MTPREREILTLIAEGNSLIEIAQSLHRSLKTVESHRLSLGRKLNVSNRVELAKIAIAEGLIQVDGQSDAPQQGAKKKNSDEQLLGWLEEINEAIGRQIGEAFLTRFCEAASLLPGIDIAVMCVPDLDEQGNAQIDQRRMIVYAEKGVQGDTRLYEAAGTPCQEIIGKGSFCTSQGVQEGFPDDAWLVSLDAQGYVGCQLTTAEGGAVGAIAFVSRTPIADTSAFRRVIDFYAARLANELEQFMVRSRIRSHKMALHDRANQYRELLHSDGDALPKVSAICKRTDALAGPRYLREMANVFSEVFDNRVVAICTFKAHLLMSDRLYTLSVSEHSVQCDTINYSVRGTPCETSIEKGYSITLRGLSAAYPQDKMLEEQSLEAYAGIRLDDEAGRCVGVMWCSGQEPLEAKQAELIVQAMRHFAPRIAAEVQRQIEFEALAEAHEIAKQRVETLASEIQSRKQ